MSSSASGLFPALLRHWRHQGGLSQLDLAIAADVSARHISFLETGRSSPSAEMVVRLGAAIGVPLRHVDAMLTAAGHEPVYDTTDGQLPPVATQALDLLKRHHEPFPLVVVDRVYRVVDTNDAGERLLTGLLGAAAVGANLARAAFDPSLAQPMLSNFEVVGRQLLWRIQREVLADPDDGELRELLDDLLAQPTVADDWREVDLSVPSEPVLRLDLSVGDVELSFVSMMTVFQAPQNVAVEQLRIETWFPVDDATAEHCRRLAVSPPR